MRQVRSSPIYWTLPRKFNHHFCLFHLNTHSWNHSAKHLIFFVTNQSAQLRGTINASTNLVESKPFNVYTHSIIFILHTHTQNSTLTPPSRQRLTSNHVCGKRSTEIGARQQSGPWMGGSWRWILSGIISNRGFRWRRYYPRSNRTRHTAAIKTEPSR